MRRRVPGYLSARRWVQTAALAAVAATAPASAAGLRPLQEAAMRWRPAEFAADGIALGGANPFDPDRIKIDADVVGPDGLRTRVPMFWLVPQASRLDTRPDGKEAEVVTPDANHPGTWRLRWTPVVAGRHEITVRIERPGVAVETLPPRTVRVDEAVAGARGFVRTDPVAKRYFKTDDGRPLPLFGLNACWPGPRGTFDYADWLPAMARNGVNYTRLWMGNAGFRAELYADERTRYNQATLWQLDRVMDLAAANGVNVLLCIGYHGEFQTELDGWGNTGWWATHAYNRANGGPCEKPNDFFTDPAAARLYEKRLRYLVARYGADTNLLAWQFFNEINNIYGDANATPQALRDANRLVPADVVAWYARMSAYLKSIDPYGHPVTTSFGSAGDDPRVWAIPSLDYVNWHWYANWGGPYTGVTEMAAGVGRTTAAAYGKPTVIAEFGTDGRGWGGPNDSERRGLRQALWGGVFCGTAGTSMPWWWETIHAENLYPLWKSVRDFLPDDFGGPAWQPLAAVRPPAPPAVLGKPGVARFDQQIDLSTRWAKGDERPTVVNRPGDDGEGRATGYAHGTSKPEMRTPLGFQFNADRDAFLSLRINSVAADSTLVVRQNGRVLVELSLPNKDGKAERADEYGLTVRLPLTPGRADIDITNGGPDWVLLDHLKIEGALASEVPPVADDAVPLEHYLIGDGNTRRLLWVVDSRFSWPRNRTRPAATLGDARLTLDDWPDGTWAVQWWDTRNGRPLRRDSVTTRDRRLSLKPPPFAGDIAARLTSAGAK